MPTNMESCQSYGISSPMAVFLSLLFLILLRSSAAKVSFLDKPPENLPAPSTSFARIRWSKPYLTSGTNDTAHSMTVDDGNGYIFLVGETSGPRGMNVSFPGLLQYNVTQDGKYDASKNYTDGIVATVHTSNGKVEWAKRLLYNRDTTFSAVGLASDNTYVYAAGVQVEGNGRQIFLYHAYDVHTVLKKEVLVSLREGRIYISSAVAHEGAGIFVCGQISYFEQKPPHIVSGMLIARVSSTSGGNWVRQGMNGHESDKCVSVSKSTDGGTVFGAVNVDDKGTNKDNRGLAKFVKMFAINGTTGGEIWNQTLKHGTNVYMEAFGIVVKAGAVFVSTSVWSEGIARKAYVHKLSETRGTKLWSKETCCSSISEKGINGTLSGSFHSIPGVAIGLDGYIYHVGYHEKREVMANDGFALVVVRVGAYGERRSDMDISKSVVTLDSLPLGPKQAVFSSAKGSIYVLTNHVPHTSVNKIPKLDYITFDPSTHREFSKYSQGRVYLNLTFQVVIKSGAVPAGAVNDVLIEWLRLLPRQLRFEDVSSEFDEETLFKFSLNVFGESPDSLFDKIGTDLQKFVYTASNESQKNAMEKHFRLAAGSIRLKMGSIHRKNEGTVQSISTVQERGQRAEINRGFGSFGAIMGLVAAGVASIGLVAIFLLLGFSVRSDMSRRAASTPVFDGRPVEGDAKKQTAGIGDVVAAYQSAQRNGK